ncbi:MAG: CotH kinase family protein [Burkholderiaceae bacterium]
MSKLFHYLALPFFVAALTACGGGGGSSDNGTDTGLSSGGSATTVLPKIYINTAGGAAVENTEDYVDATIRIVSETGAEALQADTKIRGRGNTTWGQPKKPYRLKLETAASVLGMPAARNWGLLANYLDKTLVRNKLAMNLGEQFGLPYNPRSKFVEMYFNGEYQGMYQLFEHVETGVNRVNVEKLDPDTASDPNVITGGYFMEVDHRLDEDVCWYTTLNVPICSKDPEYDPTDVATPGTPSNAQYTYITDYVNRAEQALQTAGNSYQNYFEVDAMVNYYLVSELLKNVDSQINPAGGDVFTSSVFLYKPRGGKLNFGPLWDFDLGVGNVFFEDPTGWYIRNSVWHGPLFANSDFGQRVHARWCQLKRNGSVTNLPAQVDAIVASIEPAAIDRNFVKWNIFGQEVYPGAFVGESYQDEVTHLKSWLANRVQWMDAELTREHGACPAS